jgi:hypothetical protein
VFCPVAFAQDTALPVEAATLVAAELMKVDS